MNLPTRRLKLVPDPFGSSAPDSNWVHWHLASLLMHPSDSLMGTLDLHIWGQNLRLGWQNMTSLWDPARKWPTNGPYDTKQKHPSPHPKTWRGGKSQQFLRNKGGVRTRKLLEQEVKEGIKKPVTTLLLFYICFLQGLMYLNLASNSLCSGGWLWTPDPPVSISQVLGLQTCVVTPSSVLPWELNLGLLNANPAV